VAKRKRAVLVTALAVIGTFIIGGVAVASIPDPDGVIHGCRKTADGSLRVIDSATTETCPNGFVALNWSQAGPVGPVGPAGPVGPLGPAGVNGVSGYEVVLTSGNYTAGHQFLVALCPEGKQVLGGSGTAGSLTPGPDGNNTLLPVYAQPAHSGGTSAWNAWGTNVNVPDDGRTYYLQSFAICGIVG